MKFSILSLISLLFLQATSLYAKSTSTSFISITSKDDIDNIDNKLSTSDELIDNASIDSPIIVFQFDRYRLLEKLVDYNNNGKYTPSSLYLNKFFSSRITTVVPEDLDLVSLSEDRTEKIYQFHEIPNDISRTLYETLGKKKSTPFRIIWFEFTSKDIDINELDAFLENVTLLLEEYLEDEHLDIILNTRDKMTTLEQFDESIEESKSITASTTASKQKASSKPTKGTSKGKDDDILSEIWTEGLLMCLLVSAMLLWILIMLISWIMNISISYGALEKSTNPLKKNQ
ncbi:hypothetical protein KAFR_0K01690 [Kazachstania africana CBS 2517]|uniref:V-type proton ATPase subunit S1/VOA1 transmembrane domain-containing protein n=1 Tax=Kazachstania africana (strain ATCC 22294 / BCRC 22015 / CBS 2517 / CECT 1963 / NBRC 1671 / NRRL Y-8276) TaxID=1071382 RepID=H2B1M3_KAZAF|nr:hypothetical protein KAFR_0K01690 [Kazachstania africana CBS 2517]CCF60523.1 hypothetical protein KAFR_0K01690 [Kazachstania africana CBS 2517]